MQVFEGLGVRLTVRTFAPGSPGGCHGGPGAIALYSIFLAFGAALFCGLVFGTYPAARAAALRPVEALRYE